MLRSYEIDYFEINGICMYQNPHNAPIKAIETIGPIATKIILNG